MTAARALALAAALACAGLGCPAVPPTPPSGPPDVVLVVLDTLRQDRVGSYGYARDTTPSFDALARRGTRFAQARSTSSWTSPAHASLFTGLLPASHGTTQERWDLSTPSPTLAERLRERGYRTLATVANPMLARPLGFARGFESYHEAWVAGGLRERLFPRSVDEHAVAWATSRLAEAPGRPVFLFVNLVGIHSPYDSCGESCGAFGAQPVGGGVENRWQDYYLGRMRHDAAGLRRLSDLYDAEVREVDRLLGELVAGLDAARGARPQLLVVTSDHGENLGEHGHVDHVFTLYESTVRVPLVAVGPGFAAGAVSEAPVQLHDVFASALEAAGAPAPGAGVEGLPLLAVPHERPAVLEYGRPVQATRLLLERATPAERERLAPYQRRLSAVVLGGRKLIRGDDGLRELYDLAADPAEETNLTPAPADVALEEILDELARAPRGKVAAAPPAPADPETRAALESLGYLE